MTRPSRITAKLLLLGISITAPILGAQPAPNPLSASQLMALVAGNALPENVVHYISIDGLGFRPDDAYRALLKTAGADASILTALNTAKVTAEQKPEAQSGEAVLEHLSKAGGFLNAKRYADATSELKSAFVDSFGRPESGFVMGEAFRQQEDWGEAAAIYNVVLHENADFPEAHTKLSFVLYRAGDAEQALIEAKTALSSDANNAEAHKNAGLALEDERKFDAATEEYKEALRIKPDYAAVRYNLGNLYREMGQLDNAIAEYEKSLALNPNQADFHFNLAFTFEKKGDVDSAIREYRLVKSMDPTRYDARANLGSALIEGGHYQEAVAEFRALEAMYPNAEICHECLGNALFNTWDFAGAEKEFTKAIEIDPSAPGPYLGLGNIRTEQKQYDAAIAEYRKAGQLNPDSVGAHSGAGSAFLAKKDYVHAAEELKQAEDLKPSSADIHDKYGQSLAGLGKTDEAIGEFKQSLALDSKQLPVMIALAGALEKKNDWASAMNEYRKAALADASMDLRNKVVRADAPNPQNEYKAAQERFNEHIASLNAGGKSADAARLEASIHALESSAGASEQLDAALQAGMQANQVRHFDEAKAHFQKAVDLASQLQPHDQRLVTALDYLGNENIGQNPAAAEAAFERELKVTEEIYGPQSPNMAAPLESLGNNALIQKDYASAEKFYFRGVDVNEKVYGEGSDKVAASLLIATRVYMAQKEYAKAEPYLLRAMNIDESLYGKDSFGLALPLSSLCSMYDQWKKPDKSEPCDRQLLGVVEKQFGANSPVLAPVLTSEAQALRDLGRTAEADAVDHRLASIRAATMTSKNN